MVLNEIEYKDIEKSFKLINQFGIFEKYDNTIIIRVYNINHDSKKLTELLRFYIDSSGIKKEHLNKRIIIKNPNIFNLSREIIRNTKLEYLSNIFEEKGLFLSMRIKYDFLIYFIESPYIEQLYKMGMNKVIDFIIEASSEYNSDTNLNKPIKMSEVFTFDNTQKTALGALGINKYQFKKIKNCMEKEIQNLYLINNKKKSENLNLFTLNIIKDIAGVNNISSIDNKSFDILYDICYKNSNIEFKREFFHRLYSKIVNVYDFKTLLCFINKPFLTDISGYARIRLYNQFMDYIDMVDDLELQKTYKPYIKNKEDIKFLHDSVMSIYKLHESEINEEKFFHAITLSKQFEYYDDDKYIIISPSTSEDVAMEGVTLHHCVGSYIKKIIKKETYILFLRKKNNIDKPFYTIEVTPRKKVRQIHGFGNSNVSNTSELIDFIKAWAQNKNLVIDEIDRRLA